MKARVIKETKGSSTSICKLSTKELARESGALAKVRVRMKRMAKVARTEAKDPGRKAVVRKEAKDKRRVAKVKGTCGKTGHIAACCRNGGKRNLYAMDADDSESTKDSIGSEEDLKAWCILEESESEQWQEVISRRSRLAAKRRNQASLLSVETSRDVSPKKIVGEKDRWVKVRVTMDSGAAGDVMLEAMFPHVKRGRKTSPEKFVAANGEQIKDLGEKRIRFKTNEGVQRCITFRSANVVKPLISMQKVVQAGNTFVLDGKNPHIRNTRDGSIIKLDANNGVYTMGLWICLDETGPVFSWQDSEWSSRFRQACKAGSIVQNWNSGKEEIRTMRKERIKWCWKRT